MKLSTFIYRFSAVFGALTILFMLGGSETLEVEGRLIIVMYSSDWYMLVFAITAAIFAFVAAIADMTES